MKLLIDTNVILDVLCNREEFAKSAIQVFKLCEVKKVTGCISALSVANIVYILRKEMTREKVKETVDKLALLFTIVDLKGEDIKKATELDFTDYEDALQSSQATRIKANYIVTRNIKDYKNSKVTAIKPTELLERI